MPTRQFGISTHLYHELRLGRDHLLEIAAHGFETIELFATRSHLDYHNVAAIADLQQWLAEAGLTLHSVHGPIGEAYEAGRVRGGLSLASADPDARAAAVAETERALHIARRLPVKVMVLHLGIPRPYGEAGGTNRPAATRSVDELLRVAEPLGVQLALEVIPNDLSRATSLVHMIEADLDGAAGICLDFGHAHLEGDVVDAIETVAEHVIATHVHDNGGRTDDHLMPLDGTIDWAAALTAVQKVGYDGPLVFELAGGRRPARDLLARAQQVRRTFERMLVS